MQVQIIVDFYKMGNLYSRLIETCLTLGHSIYYKVVKIVGILVRHLNRNLSFLSI